MKTQCNCVDVGTMRAYEYPNCKKCICDPTSTEDPLTLGKPLSEAIRDSLHSTNKKEVENHV